jgi:Fe2+ or Zn2+ uptake regulation protein
MSWAAAKEADRRISILLLLAQDAQGSANELLLQEALPNLGHDPSLDAVRADLAFLADSGLVTILDLHGLMAARLTARGEDVAAGRTTVPGVKKPRRGTVPPASG